MPKKSDIKGIGSQENEKTLDTRKCDAAAALELVQLRRFCRLVLAVWRELAISSHFS
jgi:hypothetical protein